MSIFDNIVEINEQVLKLNKVTKEMGIDIIYTVDNIEAAYASTPVYDLYYHDSTSMYKARTVLLNDLNIEQLYSTLTLLEETFKICQGKKEDNKIEEERISIAQHFNIGLNNVQRGETPYEYLITLDSVRINAFDRIVVCDDNKTEPRWILIEVVPLEVALENADIEENRIVEIKSYDTTIGTYTKTLDGKFWFKYL